MTKTAFIGLGVMGYHMAGHLAAKGHEVTVYNRTAERAEKWLAEHKGRAAPTPAEAAGDAEFVLSCVGNDDDVRAIALGDDGVLAGMAAGGGGGSGVFIDHTTASARLAVEMHGAAKALGIGFIDAPVSGGEAGAEAGILSVMCGGDGADFEAAKPVMESYGRTVSLIGGAGSGQKAKMVNQICIAGLVQALSEGLDFGRRSGLDMEAVLEVISGGAAQSWQMENRAATMLEDRFDFGFAIDWMIKDLGICIDEGRENGASLETTKRVLEHYRELSAAGHGRLDTSSLIKRLG